MSDCNFTPPVIGPCVESSLVEIRPVNAQPPLIPIPCIPTFGGSVRIAGTGWADVNGSAAIRIIPDKTSECGYVIAGQVSIHVPVGVTPGEVAIQIEQTLVDLNIEPGGGDPNSAPKNGDCANNFSASTMSASEYLFTCCGNDYAGWRECGNTLVVGGSGYYALLHGEPGGQVHMQLSSQGGDNLLTLSASDLEVIRAGTKRVELKFDSLEELEESVFIKFKEIDVCADGNPRKMMIIATDPYEVE